MLSSDLDELVIWQIITQIQHEAPRYGVDADQLIKRLVYGVGTRLITSWGEPALGGVYKLVAVKKDGDWSSAIKISETPSKITNPGSKRVWRIYDRRQKAVADLVALEDEDPTQGERVMLRHPGDHTKYRVMNRRDIARIEPLHVEVLRQGKLVYELPSLEEIRARRQQDVAALDPGIRRLVNPHIYHVSLTQKLWDLKQELIAEARQGLKIERSERSASDSACRQHAHPGCRCGTLYRTLILRPGFHHQPEDVAFGDDADHLAVAHDGQAADLVFQHAFGGFLDRGAGVDGDRVIGGGVAHALLGQQQARLSVHFVARDGGLAQNVAACDDAHKVVVNHRQAAHLAFQHQVIGFRQRGSRRDGRRVFGHPILDFGLMTLLGHMPPSLMRGNECSQK